MITFMVMHLVAAGLIDVDSDMLRIPLVNYENQMLPFNTPVLVSNIANNLQAKPRVQSNDN